MNDLLEGTGSMKSYTIYRNSRNGVLECCAFNGGKMFLHTSMTKDNSAPVMIETANIRLKSDYDADQTLIPGVTKRTVFYRGMNIRFAEIRWNRDETYTIDFGDESMQAAQDSDSSFSFTQNGIPVGTITRTSRRETPVFKDGVSYEPSYVSAYDESTSQQAQIMMMVFPILYFGF